jgi:hypothetical protein
MGCVLASLGPAPSGIGNPSPETASRATENRDFPIKFPKKAGENLALEVGFNRIRVFPVDDLLRDEYLRRGRR